MRFSLRKKTVIVVIIIAAIFSGIAIVTSGKIINDIVDESHRSKATELADTVAVTVDTELADRVAKAVMSVYYSVENKVGSEDWGSDEFYAYLSNYDEIAESEDFIRLREELQRVQAVNDIDCIYLSTVDPVDEKMIYIVDAALEDACPPGTIDPLYDINKGLLTNPARGFPAYITNTEEYGWLVTAGVPVYSESGEIVTYSMVDISMDAVRALQRGFTYSLIVLLLIATALVSLVAIFFINRSVVRPINTLAKAAEDYCKKESSAYRYAFSALNIHTGDEIEALAGSMSEMERDLNDHISNIIAMSDKLSTSEKKAAEMGELAKKDALTGVRNRLAYDIQVGKMEERIKEGHTSFGIAMVDLNFLKKINDTYGHERGNEAIMRLSNIVCGNFVHSPVFRIGGDEFVIILQNEDYLAAKERVEDFNALMDEISADISLRPWERTSASIGYALFEPGKDKSVDDVFRRADFAMYLRKKEMKAVRGWDDSQGDASETGTHIH